MDEPEPRLVTPRVDGRVVICECGSPMRLEGGRRLEDRMGWHWWRCRREPDHLTCALPTEKFANCV